MNNRPTRVFIGGPSRSGKTTLARLIASQTDLTHQQMDTDLVIRQLRRLKGSRLRDGLMRQRVLSNIRRQRANTITEIGLLDPNDLGRLAHQQNRFLIFFVGYPNVVASDKYALLKQNNFAGRKMLQSMPEEQLISWINDWKRQSKEHQAQCAVAGIPYFDFSDGATLDAQQQKAAAWVKVQLEG